MKENTPKINLLLLVPAYYGGVQNYFNTIINHLDVKNFEVKIFYIGKRSISPSLINRLFHSIKDLIFLFRCCEKYDLIHINTTLGYRALIRDGIFHLFAKRFYNKKTIVFFHNEVGMYCFFYDFPSAHLFIQQY